MKKIRNNKMHDCPICNSKEEFNEYASFDTCRICGWEDDDFQIDYPDETGANRHTLNQAREIWSNGGALRSDFPNTEISESKNKNILELFKK